MAELKPCPFCGEREVIVRTIRCANAGTVITRFYAQCRGCFAQTGMDARTQKSAIDAWNRRAKDD